MKKIALLSGKGGTGKSTIALSLAYYTKGALLDLDLTAPNIPIYVKGDIKLENEVFYPIIQKGAQFFSVGYFSDEPLTWNSAKLHALVNELFTRIAWKNSPYLFIDCPPGIPQENISLLNRIDCGAIVTNPSSASYSDAKRIATLLEDEDVPIAGEIRNMCYYKCRKCGSIAYIFEESSHNLNIPLICEIPIVEVKKGVIPKKYLSLDEILNSINHPVIKDIGEKKKRRIQLFKEITK